MSTSARKQREIGQRERLLLGIARKMLIEQGYAGLSMDRLAEATEYSKGTVYQHFSTKEDLVTALAVESARERLALFRRAREFRGRSRERIVALGVADGLFALLYPHYFRSELIISMADLESRVSEERYQELVRQEGSVVGLLREAVQEAVGAGDLSLQPPLTVEGAVFGLFSMAVGAHTAAVNFAPVLRELGGGPPLVMLHANFQALLDGLGWRPFRSEWDYDATYGRIALEIFPEESGRAGLV
jgi:AcrR family transcriptional regulator